MRLPNCLLSCLLAALATGAHGADESRVLVMAGDDYCPLTCDPSSGHKGLAYDFAEQLFAPLGWRIEYRYLPWQRAVKQFKAGQIDLLPGVPLEGASEQEQAQFAKTPLMNPPFCFYTQTGRTWYFQGSDSLLSGKLAVIGGYYYWPELRAYLAAHQQDGRVITLATERAMQLAMLGLQRGRFDYFVELRPAVEYQLRQQQLGEQIREAGCLQPYPLYMAFSPDFAGAAELSRHWERHYLDALHSPAGRALLQRYGLTPQSLLQ